MLSQEPRNSVETITEDSPRSKRVAELDGLRAFAILLVLLNHWYPREGAFQWIGVIGEAGWIGVDLFFVLSGYLITGILLDTAHRPHYYRNFIARRTLRIFPLYYACLVLFTASTRLSGYRPWESLQSWGGVGWFFFYVGNMRVAWMHDWPSIFLFVPLWSLQIEEQFYLAYPLVIARLSRLNIGRLLMICVVAAPVLRLCFLFVLPSNPLACYVLTPCRMDSLALGGLVAMMARSPSAFAQSFEKVRLGAIVMGAAALGVYVFCRSQGSSTEYHPLMASIGYSLIDFAFAGLLSLIVLKPTGRLVGLLRSRPLVYTGQIAYGLYLLHEPASLAVRKLISFTAGIDIAGQPAAAIPIFLVASYAAAGLSWRFFESPILGLKSRFTV